PASHWAPLLTPYADGAAKKCPIKMVSYGGNCYKLFAYKVSWIEAEKSCQDYVPGAHLASIHSFVDLIETTNYILDYHNNFENVWIGLYRIGKHSNSTPPEMMKWMWSDGSTSGYRYWDEGEPNNANSAMSCVELLHEAGYLYWNDEDCEVKHRFICKYKINNFNAEFLKSAELDPED
ncbi:hypothetical protein JD844_029092, partial [Phrynosoma platyrhinos]